MKETEQQKKLKPKAEDRVNELLSDEKRESALSFLSWLQENRMKPGYASTDSWKASYKGKGICYIRLIENNWTVNFTFFDINVIEAYIVKNGLQDFIWNNLYFCRSCHPAPCRKCDKTFFSKEFKGLCGGRPIIHCTNPDTQTMVFIKQLIENMKNDISL